MSRIVSSVKRHATHHVSSHRIFSNVMVSCAVPCDGTPRQKLKGTTEHSTTRPPTHETKSGCTISSERLRRVPKKRRHRVRQEQCQRKFLPCSTAAAQFPKTPLFKNMANTGDIINTRVVNCRRGGSTHHIPLCHTKTALSCHV